MGIRLSCRGAGSAPSPRSCSRGRGRGQGFYPRAQSAESPPSPARLRACHPSRIRATRWLRRSTSPRKRGEVEQVARPRFNQKPSCSSVQRSPVLMPTVRCLPAAAERWCRAAAEPVGAAAVGCRPIQKNPAARGRAPVPAAAASSPLSAILPLAPLLLPRVPHPRHRLALWRRSACRPWTARALPRGAARRNRRRVRRGG
jgi:hypothetical protein